MSSNPYYNSDQNSDPSCGGVIPEGTLKVLRMLRSQIVALTNERDKLERERDSRETKLIRLVEKLLNSVSQCRVRNPDYTLIEVAEAVFGEHLSGTHQEK